MAESSLQLRQEEEVKQRNYTLMRRLTSICAHLLRSPQELADLRRNATSADLQAKERDIITKSSVVEEDTRSEVILKALAKILGLCGLAIFGKQLFAYVSKHITENGFPWQGALFAMGISALAQIYKRYGAKIDSFIPDPVREYSIPAVAAIGIASSLILQSLGREADSIAILKTVVAIGGTPLLIGTLSEVFSGKLNVDVIAMISLIGGVILKEYLASAVIVLMLSGGEALESYAVTKAGYDLQSLKALTPTVAHRMKSAESQDIKDIPLDQVIVGDVLLVRPGEMIPADCVVVKGSGLVNQTSLTGESLPAEKHTGDLVLSGATNMQSALVLRVERKPSESTFAEIQKELENALTRPGRMEKLSEKYATYFTPTAVFLSSLAFIVNHGKNPWQVALTVLNAATPCPLLIAVPVAIIAALGVGARNGVIIKSGLALESLAKVDTIVFDKTGTLTVGTPLVEKIVSVGKYSANQILQFAASAEKYATHILAEAVCSQAEKDKIRLLQVKNLVELDGQGVRAEVLPDEPQSADTETVTVTIGNIKCMTATGVNMKPLSAKHSKMPELRIISYVAVDGVLEGYFVFNDMIRKESALVVAQLKRMGIKNLVLISGDTQKVVQSVANQVGIPTVFADCLPKDKAAHVDRLRRAGHNVMFIGDGVNDALAIARSNCGVAFSVNTSQDTAGTAANISSECSDVVIIRGNLWKIVSLLQLSKQSMAIAKQSALGGMCASLAVMSVALTGHLSPVYGALAQEGVDLVSILNALRVIGVASDVPTEDKAKTQ